MNNSSEQQPLEDDAAVVDPQLTQLVAYLDGELPAEASERVEQQLSADPPLRQQADALDRTWQMLSLLEEVPASAEFVGKTLATIQTLPATDSDSTDTRSRVTTIFSHGRLLSLAIGLTLGFAATTIGFSLARNDGLRNSARRDIEILRQLDLLQRYPELRAIPDEAFLQALAAADTAGGEP